MTNTSGAHHALLCIIIGKFTFYQQAILFQGNARPSPDSLDLGNTTK